MVSYQTIQTLAILFAPFLLPRLIAFYRSIRYAPPAQIQPLDKKVSYSLAILCLSSLIAFLSTLPLFHPANIFHQTQSRLGTSAGVLLTRLSALRPLTPADHALRTALDSGLDARLLYARYGPTALIECTLARPGDLEAGRSFFLYALPGLAAPHVAHLIALGVATSGTLGGAVCAKWRTLAVVVGVLLLLAEIYWVGTYDDTPNQQSVRVNDVDFVYWKLLVWRGLGIAATDALIGWGLWLQATGRALRGPKTEAERVTAHAQQLELVLAKARALGVLRNATARDAGLRRTVEGYWVAEGEVMKEVHEDPNVLQAQRSALQRIDANKIGRDAETYVDGIMGMTFASDAPTAVRTS